MRIRAEWGGARSPRLPAKILIGLLTGTLLASAGLLAFPSQSFSVGDLNLAAADTIRGSGGGRLASYPALSGDGSTVIFGQPGHWGWAGTPRATVEVREWNGSSWVAKGALPDAANREIGYWSDISDNGDVVSYSTHVLDKVFVADWSGSAWVQRPTITASQAGVSLVRHSLSGDGNVLVIGERLFDNGGEVNNGKVRTFDWDGSSWSERTAIIGAEGEQLGNSRMDITADGATISFGGSLYSNADGAEVGRVRVATWDGASWAERPALTGSQASARAANPVLSDDGTVLVFSEAEWRVSGRIRTFDWRDSAWVERPRAADGAIAWIDTDMSANGTAISMSDNDTQKVRVYDWVGDAWVQRGSDVPTFAPGGGGHYGNVVSLSSSGLSVATSQIYSDVNGSRSGRVDIYRSPGELRGVVFDSNGGSGAMSTQTNHNSAALSSSSFSKTGATFSGWNTVADGSGTDYADGDTYDFSANVTLYAQWAPIAVTFDANSGSGSMADQSAAGSTALTSNSFTRQAYSFAGWNTAADGSGTAYANGASYAFAASATLYAQWDPVVCVPDTTTVGGETVLTFTSMSGCHWTAPAGVTGYDYVVVGGGGSGGKGQQWNTAGAGGHGGQVVQGRLSVVPGQSYEVIAGNRGVGFSQPGTASVFDAVTASGGNAGPSPRQRSGVVAGGSGAGGAQSGGVGGAALGVTIRGVTEWFAAGGGGHFNYHYSPARGGVGADGTRAGGNGQTRYSSGAVDAVTYGSGGGGGSHGGNGGRSSYRSGNGYQGVVILREVRTDTVTFDANSGSGTMADQTAVGSNALTPNSFTREGHGFAGWNTVVNGSGTAYADGATYDFSADLLLYAQWGLINSVTFDANSGSGSMADQTAAGSTALTSNSFTRQAYSFAGWNTAADGSGTAYADGASYAFAASATLYAQWDPVVCVPDTTTVGGETVLTFTSTTGCVWTAPAGVTEYDYVVVGGGGSGGKGQQWNTAGAGGSGGQVVQGRLTLVSGQSYEVIAGNRGVGFSQPGTVSVFDAVTASGGNAGPSPRQRSGVVPGGSGAGGAQSGGVGGAALGVTIRGVTEWFAAGGGGHFNYHYSPARGGVGADGTRAGGNGQTRYNSGAVDAVTYGSGGGGGSHGGNGGRFSYRPGNGYQGVVILRAVLTDTVTFDANSGSGTMADQTAVGSTSLSANTLSRSGYTFNGWNSSMNGSGTAYADGATYDFSADLRLYAQWRIIPPPPSAESESGNTLLIDPDPAPVTARGRAALLPEPDRPLKTAPVVIERIQQTSGSSQPAAAVALVGGEEVAVKATTRGSQAASYGVGKVTIDVGVAAKDGVVDSVGGVPSLKITKNSPASVKGVGLQPNSTMQMFLPASNGSFIELPPVAVAADGSFDGSLPLRTSGRSMPMPIGKNSIQMVGFDDEGNETVLDIPVTIAQPLPAPEINRISGERPALTPGQGLALNAGAPETATLKRSSAATSVEGEDWAVTVAGATIDSTGQTLAFTRDAPVAYSGEGFMPGTRADVWLFSDPTLVGTVDIAADGTFSANFAVDSNFVPTGNHTLQLQGVGTDGFVRAANLGVVVVDPVSTPLVPIDSDPVSWVPLVIIGTSVGGLFVLVGVTLAIRRGQRAKERLVPIS